MPPSDVGLVVPPLPRNQGHREFPFGNSREFPGIAEPTIPGGNSREFLKFWRELRGIYRSFVFFPIFIVDYDILLYNLTHCIMCTTHDIGLPPFEQNLE